MFAANVVARRTLSPAGFADWAYLTTLGTFFFSFALLGSEQLIVRSSTPQGDTLTVPAQAMRLMAGALLAFLLVYSFLLDGRLFDYSLGPLAVPVIVMIAAMQFFHQTQRARGRLVSSQTVMNAWKFALIPALLLVTRLPIVAKAEAAYSFALVAGAAYVLRLYPDVRRTTRIGQDAGNLLKVAVPFGVSLALLSALTLADRFVLEKAHPQEAFAEYVYVSTIIATPFSLLAGYFGFKEAVRYRAHYSLASVRKDSLRVLVSAGVSVAGWLLLCFLARGLLRLPFAPGLWIILGIGAAIRCGYGVLSAALSVHGSPRAILHANLATAAALGAFAWFGLAWAPSLTTIVAAYIGVWIVRFGVSFVVLPQRLSPGYRTSAP